MIEQAIDAIFVRMKEADERIRRHQASIDRLREETLGILADIKAAC